MQRSFLPFFLFFLLVNQSFANPSAVRALRSFLEIPPMNQRFHFLFGEPREATALYMRARCQALPTHGFRSYSNSQADQLLGDLISSEQVGSALRPFQITPGREAFESLFLGFPEIGVRRGFSRAELVLEGPRHRIDRAFQDSGISVARGKDRDAMMSLSEGMVRVEYGADGVGRVRAVVRDRDYPVFAEDIKPDHRAPLSSFYEGTQESSIFGLRFQPVGDEALLRNLGNRVEAFTRDRAAFPPGGEMTDGFHLLTRSRDSLIRLEKGETLLTYGIREVPGELKLLDLVGLTRDAEGNFLIKIWREIDYRGASEAPGVTVNLNRALRPYMDESSWVTGVRFSGMKHPSGRSIFVVDRYVEAVYKPLFINESGRLVTFESGAF